MSRQNEMTLVKVISQGSRSLEKNVLSSAADAVDLSKIEVDVGQTSRGAVREDASDDDTVPVCVCRGGVVRCTE